MNDDLIKEINLIEKNFYDSVEEVFYKKNIVFFKNF